MAVEIDDPREEFPLNNEEFSFFYNRIEQSLAAIIPGGIKEDVLESAVHAFSEKSPWISRQFMNSHFLEITENTPQEVFQLYKEHFAAQKPQENGFLTEIDPGRKKPRRDPELAPKTRSRLAVFALTIPNPEDFNFSEDWVESEVKKIAALGVNQDKLQDYWEALAPDDRLKLQAGITVLYEADQIPIEAVSPLKNLAYVADDLDLRVTYQLSLTRWYLEKMGLSPEARTSVIETLLDIQLRYRTKGEREVDKAKSDPEKLEVAFNHFLSVLRTSLALLDMAQKSVDKLDWEGGEFYAELNHPQHLVELCITAAIHDIVEDKDSYTEAELHTLLQKTLKAVDTQASIGGIDLKQRCEENSRLLNTKNFPKLDANGNQVYDQKGKLQVDHKAYTQAILDSNNPALILVKAADILVNRFSNPNEIHSTSHTPEKEKAYIDFIYTLTIERGLIPTLPPRFIVDIVREYPSWAHELKARACLKYWIGNMSKKADMSLHLKAIQSDVGQLISNLQNEAFKEFSQN